MNRKRLDPDLRFALWPMRPSWLMEPVTSVLRGRRLSEVPCPDAAEALQLVGLLQAIRASVASIPVLVIAGLLDVLGANAGWAPTMWILTVSAILVLPVYGVLLGALQMRVRRSGSDERPLAAVHPRLIPVLRVAPWLALLVAVPLGVLLHP